MATSLPRLIAFGSNNRYLQYSLNTKSVQLSSQLVLSEGSFTRFEVVRTGPNSDLVHIRSSYNNKFLRRENTSTSWLVPVADEPEADRSKDTCTLFRTNFANNRVRLFFQTRNGELNVGLNNNDVLTCGAAASRVVNFDAIDLSSLVLFPKHVAFKGDNDLYLVAFRDTVRGDRLRFSSNNREDPAVHQETFVLPNGDVRIRSISLGGFWRKMNAEWIKCDSQDTTANNPDTVFRPVRRSLTEKSISLINLGNNKYCMRWIWGGQPKLRETLTASAMTMEPLTRMTVEEAILDRQISDIVYNIDDIRIYNEVLDRTVPITARNTSYTNTDHQFLIFTYRELTRETFTSSHSWKVAYQSRLNVTVIPKLVKGEVEWNASYEGNISWEEVREESKSVTSGLIVPIPPRTISYVTGLTRRATIDVPYSYKQRDILLDGRVVISERKDGLFTGVNTWLFDYESREEPLDGVVTADDNIVVREYRPNELKEEEEDERPTLPSKL